MLRWLQCNALLPQRLRRITFLIQKYPKSSRDSSFLALLVPRVCSCASKKSCNLHEASSHACSLMLLNMPARQFPNENQPFHGTLSSVTAFKICVSELREMGKLRRQGQQAMPLHLVKHGTATAYAEWSTIDLASSSTIKYFSNCDGEMIKMITSTHCQVELKLGSQQAQLGSSKNFGHTNLWLRTTNIMLHADIYFNGLKPPTSHWLILRFLEKVPKSSTHAAARCKPSGLQAPGEEASLSSSQLGLNHIKSSLQKTAWATGNWNILLSLSLLNSVSLYQCSMWVCIFATQSTDSTLAAFPAAPGKVSLLLERSTYFSSSWQPNIPQKTECKICLKSPKKIPALFQPQKPFFQSPLKAVPKFASRQFPPSPSGQTCPLASSPPFAQPLL